METKKTVENKIETQLAIYKPVKILDIEISQPLPSISSLNENGQRTYQRALILARLHATPLGIVTIDFSSEQITAQELGDQLWAAFGEKINLHLLEDGFPPVDELHETGIDNEGPACYSKREELLKNAPFISIIIATRERVQSLTNTLNSVLALEYPKFEVILVDNAPKTEETHDFIEFMQPMFLRQHIGLRYVREDTPGLAVAHNRGLELVKSPFVAFTDDDVLIDRNWLSQILAGFQSAPDVGCVTGLVVPLELETPAQVLFEEFGGFSKGFDQKIFDLNGHRPDHPLYPYSPGLFGTGANMTFRTETLTKSGGFDPALGVGTPAMGADDLAAFFHTIANGHQLVYQPSAVVFHQHRRSYEGLRKQMYGYGTGLTVFLTKCVIDNPKLLFDIAPKVSTGLKYAFSRGSQKNIRKSINYPHELEWLERRGMLYGPIAYLKSRWRYRKYKSDLFQVESKNDPSPAQHYMVGGWADEGKGDKKTRGL